MLRILIMFLALCYGFLQAQIRMEFDAILNNTPFRVRYGDTLVYNVLLINTDTNQAFSGAVYAGFLGSNSIFSDSILIGTFQISSSDTVRAAISIQVIPAYFKEGPEVVVVWPIFNGDRGDQIADFIFVGGRILSLTELHEPHWVYVANQEVVSKEHNLKQVRIYNSMGQQIAEFSPNSLHFRLPALPRSMYLLHVTTADNNVALMKFFGGN